MSANNFLVHHIDILSHPSTPRQHLDTHCLHTLSDRSQQGPGHGRNCGVHIGGIGDAGAHGRLHHFRSGIRLTVRTEA